MKPDSNPLMSPILRKRARSPIHIKVQELQRHSCEDPDMDDNVRTKKRLLTEVRRSATPTPFVPPAHEGPLSCCR